MHILEHYPEQEESGVSIRCARVFKEGEEFYDVIANMGKWARALYYPVSEYTQREAVNKFKEDNMSKFEEKKHEM